MRRPTAIPPRGKPGRTLPLIRPKLRVAAPRRRPTPGGSARKRCHVARGGGPFFSLPHTPYPRTHRAPRRHCRPAGRAGGPRRRHRPHRFARGLREAARRHAHRARVQPWGRRGAAARPVRRVHPASPERRYERGHELYLAWLTPRHGRRPRRDHLGRDGKRPAPPRAESARITRC